MINKIFKNTEGSEFKVLKLDRIDNNFKKYYLIKFIDSGYETISRSDTIKSGKIKDKLAKNIFGVASLGYANSRDDTITYKEWYNMISRCYNPKDKSYKYYGAKGVKVEDKWLRYDLFLEDLSLIEGYDKDKFYKRTIFLDKDLKSINNKLYSLETCIFLTQHENQKQRTKEYNSKHIKIVVFPDGHEEEIENLSEFCKLHNLHRQNAQGCLNGKQKQTKGYKFYYKN